MTAKKDVRARRRTFVDANLACRCTWTISLRGPNDDDKAQCGRRRKVGDLCAQHAKMAEAARKT